MNEGIDEGCTECGKRTDHWSGKCGGCRKNKCQKCGKSVRFSDCAKKLCNRCQFIAQKTVDRRRGAMVEL